MEPQEIVDVSPLIEIDGTMPNPSEMFLPGETFIGGTAGTWVACQCCLQDGILKYRVMLVTDDRSLAVAMARRMWRAAPQAPKMIHHELVYFVLKLEGNDMAAVSQN